MATEYDQWSDDRNAGNIITVSTHKIGRRTHTNMRALWCRQMTHLPVGSLWSIWRIFHAWHETCEGLGWTRIRVSVGSCATHSHCRGYRSGSIACLMRKACEGKYDNLPRTRLISCNLHGKIFIWHESNTRLVTPCKTRQPIGASLFRAEQCGNIRLVFASTVIHGFGSLPEPRTYVRHFIDHLRIQFGPNLTTGAYCRLLPNRLFS
jgi:hypothetical protein